MGLIKYIIKEIASTGLITVYHGTDNSDQSFYKDDKLFTSVSKEFTHSYGERIFELKIDIKNPFDSTDINDIKKLYDNGFTLTDPYLYDDTNQVEFLLEKGYTYDLDKDEFPTAEDFMGTVDYLMNTWEPIEYTHGVVDWIERNNFDSIYLLEDGVETYFILDMNIIKSIKEIN